MKHGRHISGPLSPILIGGPIDNPQLGQRKSDKFEKWEKQQQRTKIFSSLSTDTFALEQ